jgi:hypothetical protein
MAAKYYIYRNLNKGGFSVRYKGRVVDLIDNAIAIDVEFKVNPGGYLKAIATHQRNVHAFVVCTKYTSRKNEIDVDSLQKVSYNPFIADQFTCNGKVITKANRVVLTAEKCYLGD